MVNLFIRAVVIYLLVFAVLRLMGKRQVSDMQPFDLVITLLIADVASVPISDAGIPLLYGVIPILALFIMHLISAKLALRSEGFRKIVCGKPVIVIARGVVLEDAMRAAKYSIGDLTEQLRVKDVFALSDVEWGILETNGSLSVLKKNETSGLSSPAAALVIDGKVDKTALSDVGRTEKWLNNKLASMKAPKASDCLFVFCEDGKRLHAQAKQKKKGLKPAAIFSEAIK